MQKQRIKKIQHQLPELNIGSLPLLPLKNVAMLPKSIIPVIVGRDISIKAVEHALKTDRMLFISAQRNAATENPTKDDVFTYGTRSTILQVMRMPNGPLKILAEGLCRAKVTQFVEHEDGFIQAVYEDIPTPDSNLTIELEATWRETVQLYTTYSSFNDKVPSDLIGGVKTVQDMDYMADTIVVHIDSLTLEDRQTILELPDLKRRLLKLCSFLEKEIDILQTEQRIRGQIQTQVDKNQREYYLHEQMKAIQKELGREDQSEEITAIRQKIKNLGLSKEAKQKVESELKRLEQMPPMSSEAAVARNYIDWIISLPWQNVSTDTINITQAETILDKNHAGLKKAKDTNC